MKKVICLILIFVLVFLLSSCGLFTSSDLGDIEHKDSGVLEYHGNEYYIGEWNCGNVEAGDVYELGSVSNWPFFPRSYYFAFEEENPLFIFTGSLGTNYCRVRGLYVREDYDMYNAVFMVENTDIEISLAQAMTLSDLDSSEINKEGYIDFYMLLKDDPRVELQLWCHKYGDSWYLVMGETYILSDQFVSLLIENNIISQ